jgi:hypothetical protein
VKDNFYKELEYVFDKFPKYHMEILLGDFSAKVGREYNVRCEASRHFINKRRKYVNEQ